MMDNMDILSRKISGVDEVIELFIEKLGLGYNHFAVIYSLANAENGQCTQKHIAEEWLIPKQTIFNICKDFKDKGLIEFFESPTDKREKIMQLTESGKAYAEPIWQQSQAISEQVFNAFGKKKTAQLFALLEEFAQVGKQQITLINTQKQPAK